MTNSFWQREKRIKDIAHFCFQDLENQKTFAKEEEEEVQEDVQKDSKVVKEYVKKLFVKVVSVFQMQIKVWLLLTLQVWSRKQLEEL